MPRCLVVRALPLLAGDLRAPHRLLGHLRRHRLAGQAQGGALALRASPFVAPLQAPRPACAGSQCFARTRLSACLRTGGASQPACMPCSTPHTPTTGPRPPPAPQVGAPPFTKPVGAELGCVTPYIIVPGPWSDADIDYHAESVATGLTQNAGGLLLCGCAGFALFALWVGGQCCVGVGAGGEEGWQGRAQKTWVVFRPLNLNFPPAQPCTPAPPPAVAGHNCLKAELVVTDAEWPLRQRFLDAVRAKLAEMPNRVAYYPGSHKKHGGELARAGRGGCWLARRASARLVPAQREQYASGGAQFEGEGSASPQPRHPPPPLPPPCSVPGALPQRGGHRRGEHRGRRRGAGLARAAPRGDEAHTLALPAGARPRRGGGLRGVRNEQRAQVD